MSIYKPIAFLLLLAATSTGIAQQRYDLDNFTGIKSEGTIPADLRKPLSELYGEDKQRVRDYNDGKLPNRDRVLEASYHINRLMSNGRILYGDPITRMVERIADTLLKDYPELRRELRFYTVKSPAVNAFATGQGMIFVTTGLVAQVENESQLAYVISHEIVHYYRKHNMEVLTRRIKNSDDEAEQMANFLKYHYRSREMENEADSLGLRLFYIGSAYDKRVTDRPLVPAPVRETESHVVAQSIVAKEQPQLWLRLGGVDIIRALPTHDVAGTLGKHGLEAEVVNLACNVVGVDELGVAECRWSHAKGILDMLFVFLDLMGELRRGPQRCEGMIIGLAEELHTAGSGQLAETVKHLRGITVQLFECRS